MAEKEKRMDLQECTKFANENRKCFIATLEGDQPRVRIVQMWFADDTGFYFQCGTYKPYYQQLRNHKKVEACFPNLAAIKNIHASDSPIRFMRVAGEIEFLDDNMELRARVIKDYPGIMKHLNVTQPEDKQFAIFRIHTGEVYIWDSTVMGKESEVEKVKF